MSDEIDYCERAQVFRDILRPIFSFVILFLPTRVAESLVGIRSVGLSLL